MAHQIDLVMDFQYGSTGKGLIAGYLAKRGTYDTAVCAFATNAGHTYIDATRDLNVMTQQLPTAITSPTVSQVLIGPGSAIHIGTLQAELKRYANFMHGKNLLIHPHAAIVEDYHADFELSDGRTKMGSTAKGVGEAYIERIRRNPENPNIAAVRLQNHELGAYVATQTQYDRALETADRILVEGAQGFSLSMYHGQYPYTTSRDVTPWQIAADCGLPYKWAAYVKVIGTLRTFPIRVNNRDGSSGPAYPDQRELKWDDLGIAPELTTVTKLPRRVFSFSRLQLEDAVRHCGGYWETRLFLNFVNYIHSRKERQELVRMIETASDGMLNPPRIDWFGLGPDDGHVMTRDEFSTYSLIHEI